MIIIKSFYRKKNVKNYIMIFASILFILTFLFISKNYIINLFNKNYERSFIYVKTTKNISKITDSKYIKEIYKCIKEDSFVVENINLNDDVIYISDLENLDIEDYNQIKVSTLQQNIYMISKNNFKNYKYDNGYYIVLDNWLYLNDFVDEIIAYGIEPENHIYKNTDVQLEDMFKYLDLVIVVLSIISVLIYVFTTLNLLIDERKKNKLYRCFGYSKKDILLFNTLKVYSINILCILLNEIFQLIMIIIFKEYHHVNYILYLIFAIVSMLLILFDNFYRNMKSVFYK